MGGRAPATQLRWRGALWGCQILAQPGSLWAKCTGGSQLLASGLGDCELAHHAAILVLENVAMVHVGRILGRRVVEPDENL